MLVEGFVTFKKGKFSQSAKHVEIRSDSGELICIAIEDESGIITIAHAQEDGFVEFIRNLGLGEVKVKNIIDVK